MTMEEVKVLFGLGRVADAIRSCDRVLANHGDSPRAAEARYLRVALLGITDPGKARQGFEELAAELEGSVWGAAARNMLGPGRIEALRHARIGWPDDPTLEVVRSLPYRPLPPDRAAEAESDAVVLLLRSQRPDGAWIVPWNLTGEAAPFVMAVTSICAGSLVGFRAREGVPAAVARALDHVLGMVEGGVLDGQTATYGFGYEVWGRTFALRLLAACSREGIGDGKRLAGAMNRLVGELERDQLEGGGWSYFKGAEIVFVTAAVLVALEDARAAGVEIPPGVTRRAAGALVRSRGPDGGFGYMLGRPGGAAESCLRSPLCALALFRAKEGGLRGVRKALVLYLKFREDVAPERGKVMCHTGVGGTAPYYLLFGYAFASEALLELPENERARFRKALLEDVLACRLEDGGFLDFIPVGRYCGTGLALGALARLREPR